VNDTKKVRITLPVEYLEILKKCREVLNELEERVFGTALTLDVMLARTYINKLTELLESCRVA